MKWRVRELGGAVAVLPSSRKHNRGSFSASSSRRGRFRSLSPVQGLRKANVFVSCLTESEAVKGNHAGWGKGTAEPHVVDREAFAAVLLKFKDQWYADHPETAKGAFGNTTNLGAAYGHWLGPWAWLEFETEIDATSIGKFSRLQLPLVPYSKAEKILIALGLEYMLSNGEIPVLKHPRWSWRQYRLWKAEQMR